MTDYKLESVLGAELDLGDRLLAHGYLRTIILVDFNAPGRVQLDNMQWRDYAPAARYTIQRPVPDVEDLGDEDWDNEADSSWGRPWGEDGHGNESSTPPRDFEPPARALDETEKTVSPLAPQPGDIVTCHVCSKEGLKVTKHGKVATHGPMLARCAGSGEDPRG